MAQLPDSFADYKTQGHKWITLATGEYYPDILEDACKLYQPVLEMFGQLVKTSESSTRLFLQISEVRPSWMRIQLSRVFRKYVSPQTPVEMLKRKTKAQEICNQFGKGFRPIQEVQMAFESRPMPDEALCAVLWEYKGRGKKGYDLTDLFFQKKMSIRIEPRELKLKHIFMMDIAIDGGPHFFWGESENTKLKK